MILVIGPYASGKRAYVLDCGYSDDDLFDSASLIKSCEESGCSLQAVDALRKSDCEVVLNAHMLVRCTDDIDSLADALSQKSMVVCAEVGAGVVPIKKDERDFREKAGRLSVQLASRARKVVRMVCGIPVVIKE